MTSVSTDCKFVLDRLPKDKDLPFPHILRVDASAGSGKTFCLAHRFIQLILSRNIPWNGLDNILAITFTNEAAREMGARVLDRLKRAAFGDREVLARLGGLFENVSYKSLQTRALEAVDRILEDYDSFQFRTIDSFVRRIVMSAPQELGLSPLEEIDPYSDRYIKEAFDRLLLLSERDPRLFSVLKEAMDNIIHFENRQAWWPVEGILSEIRYFFEKEGTYGSILFDFEQAERTQLLAKRLARETGNFLAQVESEGLHMQVNGIKALRSAAQGDLATSLAKTWWRKEDLSDLLKKSSPAPSQDIRKSWADLRKLAVEYCLSRAFQGPGAYLKLYALWSEQLKILKDRAMALFFQDINLLSRRLFQDCGVPEVMFRLGERLFHFLIDEFQDTSILQWENLRPLVTEALSRGGSLFYVGDVKQLLYSWRGSDGTLFSSVPASIPSVGKEGTLNLVLPYNWRSCRQILNFVADVFHPGSLTSALSEYDRDIAGRYVNGVVESFIHAAQKVPPERCETQEGKVHLELLKGWTNAEDARSRAIAWTLDLLPRILERRRPEDVMILVRKNREVERMSAALSSEGIPVSSERQLDIRYDPVVQDVLNFVNFLEDSGDEASLCSVITGGCLEILWQKYSPGVSPLEWVENHAISREKGEGEGLLQSLRRELPGLFRDCFEGPLRAVGYLPPYDLLCRFVRNMDLYSRFPESTGALEHLLELFHEAGPMGGIGWGGLNRIDEAPPELFMAGRPGGLKAVRIMTIHKAKGLEAPVVLLPMATLAPEPERRILVPVEKGMRIVDLSRSCRQVVGGLNELYLQEKVRAFRDELNVLYVALTRAREELYVLAPEKTGKGRKNYFLHMLNGIMGDSHLVVMGSEPEASAERDKDKEEGLHPLPDVQPIRSGGSWDRWRWPVNLVRRKRDLGIFFSHDRKIALRTGELVHRLLAMLDHPLECPCDPTAVKILLEGLSLDQPWGRPDIDISRIAAAVCHPRLRNLFWTKSGEEIWVEKDLADSEGGLHRLDRAVVSDSLVVVAEFKSGTGVSTADMPQLRGYLDILSAIYPDKKAEGFLVYLERGQIIGQEGKTWTF